MIKIGIALFLAALFGIALEKQREAQNAAEAEAAKEAAKDQSHTGGKA